MSLPASGSLKAFPPGIYSNKTNKKVPSELPQTGHCAKHVPVIYLTLTTFNVSESFHLQMTKLKLRVEYVHDHIGSG